MKRKSRVATRVLGLVTTVLLFAACTPVATSTSTPSNSIEEIVWQWTSVTDQSTKETTNVDRELNYTITFNPDGTLAGTADCTFSGTYTQENGFTIELGPSTMDDCGEAAVALQYLQLLGSVATGGLDGAGHLALETAGGEQRMLFKNSGTAPE